MSDYDDFGRWETVAVTALPAEWVNVYRQVDGSYYSRACPAMLVQERRGTNRPNGPQEELDPPYATRVEAATAYLGDFTAASSTTNYVGTFGPGELWADQVTGGRAQMPNDEPDRIADALEEIVAELDSIVGHLDDVSRQAG